MTQQTVTLPISGMTCANCAMNIERNVKKLDGVENAGVNFANEQAMIAFDPSKLGVREIMEKIDSVGYRVPTATADLPVTGMTCANCAANIQRTLNKRVPGVTGASVNFATERATVHIPSRRGRSGGHRYGR